MYQPATPVPGSPVSPLQLQAAGLLSAASELAVGLAPPCPAPVALPAWPSLPARPGLREVLADKEVGKRAARLAIYVLLAPHLLSLGSAVLGRAGRPSLRPANVAPASVAPASMAPAPVVVDQSVPVPTVTDSGTSYGG